MQRFLQFRLGSHQLPIVLGPIAGGQHVARANRVCTRCGSVAVADELHMILECPASRQLGSGMFLCFPCHAALHPCIRAAMQPCSLAAMPPCSPAALQPCSLAALQPCSPAALICSLAAVQPCCHAALLPNLQPGRLKQQPCSFTN